jgi:hypothetical protein
LADPHRHGRHGEYMVVAIPALLDRHMVASQSPSAGKSTTPPLTARIGMPYARRESSPVCGATMSHIAPKWAPMTARAPGAASPPPGSAATAAGSDARFWFPGSGLEGRPQHCSAGSPRPPLVRCRDAAAAPDGDFPRVCAAASRLTIDLLQFSLPSIILADWAARLIVRCFRNNSSRWAALSTSARVRCTSGGVVSEVPSCRLLRGPGHRWQISC